MISAILCAGALLFCQTRIENRTGELQIREAGVSRKLDIQWYFVMKVIFMFSVQVGRLSAQNGGTSIQALLYVLLS